MTKSKALERLNEICTQQWLRKHGAALPPPTLTAQQRCELEECFLLMDADGSGAIDIEEIIEAFAVLGLTIEKETVSRLMADIDPDGGGSLDWEEFAALMAHALYSTGEVGPNKQIMASAGKEALSFADAVRAFRRKRVIEALMMGGSERLKVVAFHEKLQAAIRQEQKELQDQETVHKVYEAMEAERSQRARMSRMGDVASQRSRKLKQRLQIAVSNSMAAFSGLNHAPGYPGLDLSSSEHSSPGLTGPSSPVARPATTATTSFITGLAGGASGRGSEDGSPIDRIVSASFSRGLGSACPPSQAQLLSRLESKRFVRMSLPVSAVQSFSGLLGSEASEDADTQLDGPRSRSRSLSPQTSRPVASGSFHSKEAPSSMGSMPSFRRSGSMDESSYMSGKKIVEHVSQYFKQLEDQVKAHDKRFEERAREAASFINPPPDKSAFAQQVAAAARSLSVLTGMHGSRAGGGFVSPPRAVSPPLLSPSPPQLHALLWQPAQQQQSLRRAATPTWDLQQHQQQLGGRRCTHSSLSSSMAFPSNAHGTVSPESVQVADSTHRPGRTPTAQETAGKAVLPRQCSIGSGRPLLPTRPATVMDTYRNDRSNGSTASLHANNRPAYGHHANGGPQTDVASRRGHAIAIPDTCFRTNGSFQMQQATNRHTASGAFISVLMMHACASPAGPVPGSDTGLMPSRVPSPAAGRSHANAATATATPELCPVEAVLLKRRGWSFTESSGQAGLLPDPRVTPPSHDPSPSRSSCVPDWQHAPMMGGSLLPLPLLPESASATHAHMHRAHVHGLHGGRASAPTLLASHSSPVHGAPHAVELLSNHPVATHHTPTRLSKSILDGSILLQHDGMLLTPPHPLTIPHPTTIPVCTAVQQQQLQVMTRQAAPPNTPHSCGTSTSCAAASRLWQSLPANNGHGSASRVMTLGDLQQSVEPQRRLLCHTQAAAYGVGAAASAATSDPRAEGRTGNDRHVRAGSSSNVIASSGSITSSSSPHNAHSFSHRSLMRPVKTSSMSKRESDGLALEAKPLSKDVPGGVSSSFTKHMHGVKVKANAKETQAKATGSADDAGVTTVESLPAAAAAACPAAAAAAAAPAAVSSFGYKHVEDVDVGAVLHDAALLAVADLERPANTSTPTTGSADKVGCTSANCSRAGLTSAGSGCSVGESEHAELDAGEQSLGLERQVQEMPGCSEPGKGGPSTRLSTGLHSCASVRAAARGSQLEGTAGAAAAAGRRPDPMQELQLQPIRASTSFPAPPTTPLPPSLPSHHMSRVLPAVIPSVPGPAQPSPFCPHPNSSSGSILPHRRASTPTISCAVTATRAPGTASPAAAAAAKWYRPKGAFVSLRMRLSGWGSRGGGGRGYRSAGSASIGADAAAAAAAALAWEEAAGAAASTVAERSRGAPGGVGVGAMYPPNSRAAMGQMGHTVQVGTQRRMQGGPGNPTHCAMSPGYVTGPGTDLGDAAWGMRSAPAIKNASRGVSAPVGSISISNRRIRVTVNSWSSSRLQTPAVAEELGNSAHGAGDAEAGMRAAPNAPLAVAIASTIMQEVEPTADVFKTGPLTPLHAPMSPEESFVGLMGPWDVPQTPGAGIADSACTSDGTNTMAISS